MHVFEFDPIFTSEIVLRGLSKPKDKMYQAIEPNGSEDSWLEDLLQLAEKIDPVRFNLGMMVVIVALSALFSISLWLLAVRWFAWTVPSETGFLVFCIAALVSFTVGAPAVYFGFALISRIQSIELQLRQALATADLANRSKTEFLANMSHEVRTPLNGILGMANVLETTHIDYEQKEALRVIKESGDVLMAIISEVLDLSKIDSGLVTLDPAPQPLSTVLSACVDLFRAKAKEGGNELSFTIGPDVPEMAIYDSVRVRQCLANLISNAVKFTKGGKISIVLNASTTADGWLVCLQVKDTGIGIAPKDFLRLFKPFQQVGSATSQIYGGTGLGLAISHRLAQVMGGDLTVSSVAGVGSDFCLSFKAGVFQFKAPEVADNADVGCNVDSCLEGVRVLVVDDVGTNRLVATTMLKALGASCFEAKDGKSAIEFARSESLDVILLDIRMPDIDGFAVLKEIRALEGAPSYVPIVALTADVFSGRLEDYLALGFASYLIKPLRIEDLKRQICAATSTTAVAGAIERTFSS